MGRQGSWRCVTSLERGLRRLKDGCSSIEMVSGLESRARCPLLGCHTSKQTVSWLRKGSSGGMTVVIYLLCHPRRLLRAGV